MNFEHLERDDLTGSPIAFRPIILAGGSGTRFWPLSRRARAKQVLVLEGNRSMIQQTVDRISPLAQPSDFWVITNGLLAETITEQLSRLPANQILSEPAARNTAPAAGLAAFLIEREQPNAVLGMFPADHVIGNEADFVEVLRRGIERASHDGNIVVLGVHPTRPETGYGYVQTGEKAEDGALSVVRFTEKPELARAEEFLKAGDYFWNSGIFLWSAGTLANAMREHLPATAAILERIAACFGTPEFHQVFAELYPQCENVSVDVAVVEPRSAKGPGQSGIFCYPADFGWNDLGSWTTLYDHNHAKGTHTDDDKNVAQSAGSVAVKATGNFVYSPKKFVAMVGVHDLVVVETDDAILITTRGNSQDVGQVVKQLTARGKRELI